MDKAEGLMFSLLDILKVSSWHTTVHTMHTPWTYICASLCPISFHLQGCRQGGFGWFGLTPLSEAESNLTALEFSGSYLHIGAPLYYS